MGPSAKLDLRVADPDLDPAKHLFDTLRQIWPMPWGQVVRPSTAVPRVDAMLEMAFGGAVRRHLLPPQLLHNDGDIMDLAGAGA